MAFKCPGYLNAKSLQSGGVCREDYVEWFSNPELVAYRPLIDDVYRTIQYRGDAPILLLCDISSQSCLLFRFTMESRDLKGRPHQRCEVMKIDRAALAGLLDGKFKAEPRESDGEFVVEGVGGCPLPECECRRVGNANLRVLSRNANAYWFKKEKSVADAPLKHPIENEPERRSQSTPNEVSTKNRGKIMSKILLLALVSICALGGWYYVQCNELRSRMDAQNDEMVKCRAEVSNLRKENGRLLGEINKYDKWIKTRGNFEFNKAQLEVKLNEIKEKFKEAELLMKRIDETPRIKTLSSKEKNGSSEADISTSRTNRESSTEMSEQKHSVDVKGKKGQGFIDSIKETFSELTP